MNIHTVAENLRNTIAAKQAMLDGLKVSDKEGYYIIKQWLEININELKVILHDVEQCAQQYSLMTWEINPDRMGQ